MAISMKEAQALCSPSELQLVLSAMPTEIVRLTPARLDAKIARARKLRDKFRDLGRRQRREARGKARPRGARAAAGNEGTRRKEALFTTVLLTFEERRALAEAARRVSVARNLAGRRAPKAKKKGAGAKGTKKKAKAPGKKGKSRRAALLEKSEATRHERAFRTQQRAGMRRIHAHVASRGRRSQARRDAR